MGYMHIDNLYKNQEILMFLECYAMEKIHGTSAHISWDKETQQIKFFAGGEKHENFIKLFNEEELKEKFNEIGFSKATIYGEAYGGKQQGMSETYGKELKFVVFDIRVGESWLNVSVAHEFTEILGLEFVAYEKVSTKLEDLDRERDKFSRQAKRNGIEEQKIAEGVVLRPLVELRKNNGARIMCKHKREEFKETGKPRKVEDPAKLKILSEANDVAEEWVTLMRLSHVLDKIQNVSVEKMGEIIKAMHEDIKREGDKEIVWSKPVERAIGKLTAKMTKEYFNQAMREGAR